MSTGPFGLQPEAALIRLALSGVLILVLLSSAASERPALVRALRPLIGAIDDAAMRGANKLVDLDGLTLEEAASALSRSFAD